MTEPPPRCSGRGPPKRATRSSACVCAARCAKPHSPRSLLQSSRVRSTARCSPRVRRIVELGGEHGGGTIASGPNAWPKSQADVTDRIIRPGDVVYVDLYNIGYNGYRSCYYRTFSCGTPKRATVEAHARAVDNLYSVLDAIVPGATTAEAAQRFPDEQGEYWEYYNATEPCR